MSGSWFWQAIGWLALALNVWGNLALTGKGISGWVVRLASNACWIPYGICTGAWALMANHLLFVGINAFGWWRWSRRVESPTTAPTRVCTHPFCEVCDPTGTPTGGPPMSTPITEEDRRVAHELMERISYGTDHCKFWSARTKLALHDPECTAISQALADRAATAHAEGRREAFRESLEAVATVYVDTVINDTGFALHLATDAIRSARDRGMAGKPGDAS